MKKAIRRRGGKRPGAGRPATGMDPARTIRLSNEFLDKIDHWATQQDEQPSRSEAIRRLVELGLRRRGSERLDCIIAALILVIWMAIIDHLPR